MWWKLFWPIDQDKRRAWGQTPMEDPNWVIKKDLESLACDHWPRRNLPGVLDLEHFLECRLPSERLCEDVYAESVRVLRLFLCLREWRSLALTAEACQRVNTYSCILINSYVHKYLNRVQVWYMVNSSVYEGFWKRKCTKYYVNISYRRLGHQQDFKLRIFCHPGSEIWLEFLPLFSWLREILLWRPFALNFPSACIWEVLRKKNVEIRWGSSGFHVLH